MRPNSSYFIHFKLKSQFVVFCLFISLSALFIPIGTFSDQNLSNNSISDPDRLIPKSIPVESSIKTNEYTLGEEAVLPVSTYYYPSGSLTATCVYISEYGYFFLAKELPNTANFTQAGEMLDNHMIPLLIDNFAAPTDNDNNGKIVLLFADFAGVGGYFSPSTYASYGEIIYMSSTGSIPYPTLIHELQHLVKQGYDPAETIWFNEGCSVFSEYLYDLSIGALDGEYGVFSPRDVSLLYWDYEHATSLTDYAAAGSFITYLYYQFGSANLSEIYQASDRGVKLQSKAAIMHIVNQYYPELTFERLYMNWIIASLIDSEYTGENRAYYFEDFISYPNAYKYPELSGTRIHYPYEATQQIYPWASGMYLFRNFENPDEVNITISIPETSQAHQFGVNILKKIVSGDNISYDINSFVLSSENISEGYHESFNATAESCERFFLSISHLDGGSGGYYDEIPTGELNVQFSLLVTSNLPGENSSKTTDTSSPVPFDFSLLFFVIIGVALTIRRRK